MRAKTRTRNSTVLSKLRFLKTKMHSNFTTKVKIRIRIKVKQNSRSQMKCQHSHQTTSKKRNSHILIVIIVKDDIHNHVFISILSLQKRNDKKATRLK